MKDRDDKSTVQAPPSSPTINRRIQLSDILRGQREVVIEHDGQDYRLRITAAGKLILTK